MAHSQPQGFLAIPPTGMGPGVLVLHAWWGLNDTMKYVCTRLAESGYVAFAPDLYHGMVTDNIANAETLGKALDANHLQTKAEIMDSTKDRIELRCRFPFFSKTLVIKKDDLISIEIFKPPVIRTTFWALKLDLADE